VKSQASRGLARLRAISETPRAQAQEVSQR
jgi:hypothetical protein